MRMIMKRKPSVLFLILITILLFLSGCDSRDQRVQDLMDLGDDNLKHHSYYYAIKVYDEVLIRDPENVEARYKREQSQAIIDLANTFITKGDEAVAEKRTDEALAYFQQAKELFPYNEDDGYKRNIAVFEMGEIQYYLDHVSELDSQWKKVKEDLKGGKSLSSKSMSKSIAKLYSLAEQVYKISEALERPTSSEAAQFYNTNKPDLDKMMKEFIVYQIMPQPPMYRFEGVDEYVTHVKNSIDAFGLDFQYEEADELIKEIYFINRPELKELRDKGNFPDLKMFEETTENN